MKDSCHYLASYVHIDGCRRQPRVQVCIPERVFVTSLGTTPRMCLTLKNAQLHARVGATVPVSMRGDLAYRFALPCWQCWPELRGGTVLLPDLVWRDEIEYVPHAVVQR